MARILKKIPDFKLPKYKMKEVGDLEELRMEYAEKNIDDFKKKMASNGEFVASAF